MPVTELAQLRVLTTSTAISSQQSSTTQTTPSSSLNFSSLIDKTLLSDLKHAQEVLTTASNHPFQIYQYIDANNDSSIDTNTDAHEPHVILYIIGSWDSIASHREKFLPSDTNRALLELLGERITVDFMFHIDIKDNFDGKYTRRQRISGLLSEGHDLTIADAHIDTSESAPNVYNIHEKEDILSHIIMLRHFIASPTPNGDHPDARSFESTLLNTFRALLQNPGTESENQYDILASGWRIKEDENQQEYDEFIIFIEPVSVSGGVRRDIRLVDGYAAYIREVRRVCERPVETRVMRALEYY